MELDDSMIGKWAATKFDVRQIVGLTNKMVVFKHRDGTGTFRVARTNVLAVFDDEDTADVRHKAYSRAKWNEPAEVTQARNAFHSAKAAWEAHSLAVLRGEPRHDD